MESAIFGLVGVALGALLTMARELWFQSRKEKREVEYLAVKISCILDRYAAQCSLVAADEGDWREESDGQRHLYASVEKPSIDLDAKNFEWKYLPTKLMHEILRFPFEAETAAIIVSQTFEMIATPPFYEEWYEERQFQYASLGLQASTLARKLRHHAGLDERPSEIGFNVEEHLRDVIADIEKARAGRNDLFNVPQAPASV